ncbi:MAG: YgjV family protein [bacterium]|nr:YgjV family protein [bacterium]
MNNILIEVIGYTGSALVILSLLQKSILRLRMIGFVASSTFLIYSIAIEAYPIAVVNVVAASIHLYYLRKLLRRKNEVFTILRMRPESRYLAYFLDFYKDDIAQRYQPAFEYKPGPRTLAVFLLRDMVPAGLVVAKTHGNASFEILLDYVIPQYRDFKLAAWLYSEESGIFTEANCRCAWTRVSTDEQEEYFSRVGFKPDRTQDAPERYSITLPG